MDVPEIPVDLAAAEVENAKKHLEDTETVEMVSKGLIIFKDDLASLNGRPFGEPSHAVQVILFARAWNNLYCGYSLALRGYFAPSLNLLRSPIEDWLAYWYLHSFPEEYCHFDDPSLKSPTFNEMLQKIEAKHGNTAQVTVVKEWIKHLHKYSHVDHMGVRLTLGVQGEMARVNLGPYYDRQRFLHCAAETVTDLVVLLEALENYREVRGIEPTPENKAYRKGAVNWLRRVSQDRVDAGDSDQGSKPDHRRG